MLTEFDVAKPLGQNGFSFGLTNEKIAQELRVLADKITAGLVIPQRCVVVRGHDENDFPMTQIRFKFYEKSLPEKIGEI